MKALYMRGWLAIVIAAGVACDDADTPTAPTSGPLRVRLHYAGPRNGASFRVTATSGSTRESASVGSSNEVALGSTLSIADSIEIRIDEPSSKSRRFHPSVAFVRREDLETTQKFVLIPRRWTIAGSAAGCRYTGQSVGIDLELAYARSVADPSSFYWRVPNPSGGWSYRSASFPRSAMPVPVAFDRATSTDPITGSDSATFWRIVAELESELCEDAFQPTTAAAVAAGRGVRVLVDRELDATARGGPMSAQEDGETRLVGGAVICKTAACIVSGETMRHELMHVLGFGHTCSWPSIMRAGCAAQPRATATDVAYYQVYYTARAIQLANAAQHSLAAAHQGQRVMMRGLPIERAFLSIDR